MKEEAIKSRTLSQSDEAVLYDPSRRAENVLDTVLQNEVDAITKGSTQQIKQVDVKKARRSGALVHRDSGRSKSRVLFISADENVLDEANVNHKMYVALAEQFDEVHVMVLLNRSGVDESERKKVGNVWFYTVHDKYWWRLPDVAYDVARNVLTFNGSIRPDIIVATDPFESGLAAYWIGREFERPVQVHVQIDYSQDVWLKATKANRYRKMLASYVLQRAQSVRTATDALKKVLEARHKHLKDLASLPHFYNFAGYKDAKPVFDLHEKYRDYSFIALAFGPLTADSHLHDVFSALRQMLLNPRVGLLIVGDGPGKKLFVEKTKLLGIEKNVVFVKEAEDLLSYLKTANILMHTDVTQESEELVLRAAAAGLPTMMYATDMRRDLFKDGTSAFICEPGDIHCLSTKLNKFINTPTLRTQFARNSADVVADRLEEDPATYYQAFRDSIESVLASK